MLNLFPKINGKVRISADGLALSRGGVELFRDITVSLSREDILWIHGGNGIGKTTLLEGLCGLLRPDLGRIEWAKDGAPCEASDIIAYQPHLSFAKAVMSAGEELSFWAKLRGAEGLADLALDYVGLASKAHVPCDKLSAGQKRRLALAKLIVSQKPIWIMDEPTAAIDKMGRDKIDALIGAHIARGGSAIIASHSLARALGPKVRKLTLEAANLEAAP